MASLFEGAATGAACATALALPLKSRVFAVEEADAGLGKSDCCVGIFAAARCAIARADRASDFIRATPAAVLVASEGGVTIFPEGGAAAEDQALEDNGGDAAEGGDADTRSERSSITVGILVIEGFAGADGFFAGADEFPADGVAPRRGVAEVVVGATPIADEPAE